MRVYRVMIVSIGTLKNNFTFFTVIQLLVKQAIGKEGVLYIRVITIVIVNLFI